MERAPFEAGSLRRLGALRRHFTASTAARKETVCVLGAGSFGSAIARVLAQAPATSSVNFWARRSSVADEINLLRTNKQYIDAENVFPPKVTAFTSISDSIRNASIVVIAVPSLYLQPLLDEIAAHRNLLSDDAVVVSLVKSLHYDGTHLTTVCQEISAKLQLPTLALMGPNIYKEMIRDEFAEATVGHLPADAGAAARVQEVFTTRTFRVSTCDDRLGVELCGGLKNVVSLAAGFCEGLGQGANTKAAVIRLGLQEMSTFSQHLGARPSTFYEESCGVGDLILTCTVGRGRQLAKSFVEAFDSRGPCSTVEESLVRWTTLEDETLNGMKLPDYSNAKAVHEYMTQAGVLHSSSFSLFSAIYNISYLGAPPSTILEALKTAVSSQSKSTNGAATRLLTEQVPRRNVNLCGKRCLITGAGQGIGRAIAEHVSRCGATVVGMDVNREALADLQNTLKSSDSPCDVLVCNLLDVRDIRKTIEVRESFFVEPCQRID
jgi:glycerol-3-phosphate dehydrogenase (NAD+)